LLPLCHRYAVGFEQVFNFYFCLIHFSNKHIFVSQLRSFADSCGFGLLPLCHRYAVGFEQEFNFYF